MASCVQCSVSIPDTQTVCSMCYGDPHYGSDGYYLEWLRRDEMEQDRRRQEIYREEQKRDTDE